MFLVSTDLLRDHTVWGGTFQRIALSARRLFRVSAGADRRMELRVVCIERYYDHLQSTGYSASHDRRRTFRYNTRRAGHPRVEKVRLRV